MCVRLTVASRKGSQSFPVVKPSQLDVLGETDFEEKELSSPDALLVNSSQDNTDTRQRECDRIK